MKPRWPKWLFLFGGLPLLLSSFVLFLIGQSDLVKPSISVTAVTDEPQSSGMLELVLVDHNSNIDPNAPCGEFPTVFFEGSKSLDPLKWDGIYQSSLADGKGIQNTFVLQLDGGRFSTTLYPGTGGEPITLLEEVVRSNPLAIPFSVRVSEDFMLVKGPVILFFCGGDVYINKEYENLIAYALIVNNEVVAPMEWLETQP